MKIFYDTTNLQKILGNDLRNKLKNVGDFTIVSIISAWSRNIEIAMLLSKRGKPRFFWLSMDDGELKIISRTILKRQKIFIHARLKPYYNFLTNNCSQEHVGRIFPAGKNEKIIATIIKLS